MLNFIDIKKQKQELQMELVKLDTLAQQIELNKKMCLEGITMCDQLLSTEGETNNGN